MPRRRVLDPALWTHGKVLRLDGDVARLVFLGFVSQSNDEGIVESDPAVVKAALALRAPVRRVEAAIASVYEVGLAVPYRSNGQQYAFLPGFFKHQKLERPSPSKHPRPPGDVLKGFPCYLAGRRETFNRSTSRHRGIFDDDPRQVADES